MRNSLNQQTPFTKGDSIQPTTCHFKTSNSSPCWRKKRKALGISAVTPAKPLPIVITGIPLFNNLYYYSDTNYSFTVDMEQFDTNQHDNRFYIPYEPTIPFCDHPVQSPNFHPFPAPIHPYNTDADNIWDGVEFGLTNGISGLAGVYYGTDMSVFQRDMDPSTTTDPLNKDTDGDGLWDGDTVGTHMGEDEYGSNPLLYDTDYDGLYDGWVDDGDGNWDPTDPTEFGEWTYGTDPTLMDTDGDGLWDGWEPATYSDTVTLIEEDWEYDYKCNFDDVLYESSYIITVNAEGFGTDPVMAVYLDESVDVHLSTATEKLPKTAIENLPP